ncbi:MAG: type II 3-dehydroquinate dehydratase [Crocinitomicaceae bacterium]|jgi:3-dehydroquinate dehydratase-2
MKIAIVNGPNLNLVGKREKSIYGDQSLTEYLTDLKSKSTFELELFQSNVEGELINFMQASDADAFVINAGGYSHSSIAIRDCIVAIEKPTIEVHISNIAGRESFRHESMLSPVCIGCVFGFGLKGYDLALNFFSL